METLVVKEIPLDIMLNSSFHTFSMDGWTDGRTDRSIDRQPARQASKQILIDR